jgi:hypothetical protein
MRVTAKGSQSKCKVVLCLSVLSMGHGVNGHSGHLVQNLVDAVPGDGIVSATALHQLMEASSALELMDSRSIAPSPHVQSMESGQSGQTGVPVQHHVVMAQNAGSERVTVLLQPLVGRTALALTPTSKNATLMSVQ